MKALAYIGLYALLVTWITAMVLLTENVRAANGIAIGLSVSYGASIHAWLERKIKTSNL